MPYRFVVAGLLQDLTWLRAARSTRRLVPDMATGGLTAIVATLLTGYLRHVSLDYPNSRRSATKSELGIHPVEGATNAADIRNGCS